MRCTDCIGCYYGVFVDMFHNTTGEDMVACTWFDCETGDCPCPTSGLHECFRYGRHTMVPSSCPLCDGFIEVTS